MFRHVLTGIWHPFPTRHSRRHVEGAVSLITGPPRNQPTSCISRFFIGRHAGSDGTRHVSRESGKVF